MLANLALCATSLFWSAAPAVAPAQPGTQAQAAAKTQAQAAAKTQAQATAKKEKMDLVPIEESILRFTNLERAKYRLPPLETDPELMKSARQHATWMTANQRMVHTNRPVAENIAMGQPSPQDVMRSWMNSPGHRANILNGGHRRIGVAAYRAASGTIFWCQQFRW